MNTSTCNTLPKKERLCGKKNISKLLDGGKYGNVSGMRFLCLKDSGSGTNRIMVSVSKKFFKRAVKRNLIKRRIRESYRKQKHNLAVSDGLDVLFMYGTKEIMSYEEIYAAVGQIIEKINHTIPTIEATDESTTE